MCTRQGGRLHLPAMTAMIRTSGAMRRSCVTNCPMGASDSVNIAAIVGDVACNSIVVILGEGSNLPACIIAGVLHEAVQAIDFERDLRTIVTT
jgi:hypothetical protein